MTERETDLMNRYIYDVVRRIPRDLRQETSLELEELIRDMMEEAGPEVKMEQILIRLGDPAVVSFVINGITVYRTICYGNRSQRA